MANKKRDRVSSDPDSLPESAMGGTSDAGTAGDAAAEEAAMGRGLPDNDQQRYGKISGARSSADRGTEGSFGTTGAPEELPRTANVDEPIEEEFERPDEEPS